MICLIGFSKTSRVSTGRPSSPSSRVNWMGLKTSAVPGSIILVACVRRKSGSAGVFVIDGVSVSVGVREMVGVSDIVGERVMVAVLVIVGDGGKML